MAAMSDPADKIRNELRLVIAACGSQVVIARKLRVSASFISQVINGTKAPSKRLLDALGYVKVTRYVKRHE